MRRIGEVGLVIAGVGVLAYACGLLSQQALVLLTTGLVIEYSPWAAPLSLLPLAVLVAGGVVLIVKRRPLSDALFSGDPVEVLGRDLLAIGIVLIGVAMAALAVPWIFGEGASLALEVVRGQTGGPPLSLPHSLPGLVLRIAQLAVAGILITKSSAIATSIGGGT